MDFKGNNCPVCNKAFEEDDDIVVCPKCGAPYHRDCYKEKGKCIFTDLHKEKKSWKEVYKTEETKSESTDEDDPTVCKKCGHKNTEDSIVCEKCGEFLTGAGFFGNMNLEDSDYYDETDDEQELEKLREQMRNVGPVMGSANFYSNGTAPFRFGIDETEDHDGVTTRELADYVGGNSLYYLPVFSRINKFNTSRFNFAAFLFNGTWYFYRKQYLKGTIISLLMLILSVAENAIMYFWAGDLWEKANTALNTAERMPSYHEYFSWMQANCDISQILLMLLPYFLSFISLVLMIVCGLRANKGYYQKAVSSIKKIKEENPDDDEKTLRKKIIRKGGIHLGAAFTLLACEFILNVAAMFFFTS